MLCFFEHSVQFGVGVLSVLSSAVSSGFSSSGFGSGFSSSGFGRCRVRRGSSNLWFQRVDLTLQMLNVAIGSATGSQNSNSSQCSQFNSFYHENFPLRVD